MTENNDKNKGMRNVYALGIVSFFTDLSTEMILGILPLFIVKDLGFSRAFLGTIEGSAEMISYSVRLASGSISDKIGKRKIFIVIGYTLSTVSKPFFSLTHGWLDTFAVRATDRIGKGWRTSPRDALIADSVTVASAGKAFGFHRTLDNLGAVLGPVTAFVLLQVIDIRGVFLMSLIPGIISVLVLIFIVKETVIKKNPVNKTIFSNMKIVLKNNKPFLLLLTISGIFSLGAFNYSFVLLRASDLGVEKNLVPIVYAVINITHVIVSIPSGLLADKIGKERVLLIGYGVFAISTILMIVLSGNSFFAYLLAGVFGVYMGITDTVQRAMIPRYIPSELRGTAFGIFNIVVGSGFLVSNLLFGLLWDHYNLGTAVTYSIVSSLIAICGMFVFLYRYQHVSAVNHET